MCGVPLPWWTEEIEKDNEGYIKPTMNPEETESIRRGIADADNGKLNPHSKAKEIYSKYLS